MKRLLGSLAWYWASCRSMAARRALLVPEEKKDEEPVECVELTLEGKVGSNASVVGGETAKFNE